MEFDSIRTFDSAARNAALKASSAEFVLFLPDTITLQPSAYAALQQAVSNAEAHTAAFACRLLPYGTPWHVNPVTLQANMVSMQAVLVRRAAVLAAGGFDTRLGGAAADADLCWRLGGLGYTLQYVPAAVAHTAPAAAPTLAEYREQVRSAFLLRAKYKAFHRGHRAYLAALQTPKHYPGVRKALAKAYLPAVFTALCHKKAPKAAIPFAYLADNWAPQRGCCALVPFTETPLVSIVIRTCNRPDTLRETLKCLRHQTYKHFEVVVIEDGAATAEAMIKAEFADLPIRYFATGTNVGRGRAGNIGIEKALGEYVCFLDDDDFYYPDYLELHLSKFMENSDIDLVISSTMASETEVQSRSPYIFSVKKHYPVIFDHITLMDMCVKCRIPMPGAMFKRYLYDKFGGMREDIDGDEDWAMWLRFMQQGQRMSNIFVDIPRAVSMCSYPADPQKAQQRLAAYEKYDEVMLADKKLCFLITQEDLALWKKTVAADMAHLQKTEQLQDFIAIVAAAQKADISAIGAEKSITLNAQQINRYYYYLCDACIKELIK